MIQFKKGKSIIKLNFFFFFLHLVCGFQNGQFGGLSSHFRDGLRSISQAVAAQPAPPSTDYPAERKIALSFFLFVRL